MNNEFGKVRCPRRLIKVENWSCMIVS